MAVALKTANYRIWDLKRFAYICIRIYDNDNTMEGTESPLLHFSRVKMITESRIKQLVEEKIEGTGNFIVDIRVRPGNKINILLDNENNLSISDCVEVSRYVEHQLDRDAEDFELEVSSPGLDQPFKVLRQYRKYLGKEVQVLLKDNAKITGTLLTVDDEGVEVETRAKEKVEGKKSKQLVITKHRLPFTEIKETRIVITFK